MAARRTNLYERYVLGDVLGRGGMGIVYRAYDNLMKRDVALKTILEFDNPTSLDLFYKECGTLAAMVHPNIISIYDLGEFSHEGALKPFFVMPLLPGSTLDKLIKENSPRLTVDALLDIFSQASRGLHAAHEMGLVHRDVKPSNIFVMDDGSVKIIDFGIARPVSGTHTKTIKGTLSYMSPEQLQMKPLTASSDQYSLAVVCYEALAGRKPFRASTDADLIDQILNQTAPPISDINGNVKYALSQVVHKAMMKQPYHRFPVIRDFGDALGKAQRGEAIEYFDSSKIKPRLDRAANAFEHGDLEFASEVLSELEGEGYLDQSVSLLRRRVDQGQRQRRVRQLLDSALRYFEAQEHTLALRKLQEAVDLDPENPDTLSLKNKIEKERREKKIDEWLQLARQHLDNAAFRQAREALDNVLKLKPNDTAALGLVSQIERREKDFSQVREKKAQMFQTAMQSFERGDVTAALSKLNILMSLERESPDPEGDRSATYQSFFNQVRSEHDSLKNSYEQARAHLVRGEFGPAQEICGHCLAKYPNHALFQALKFDIDERQRQSLSAFIADVDRKVDAEADPDRRVAILEDAAKLFPDEKHFESALRTSRDKRDLVNSIVDKAHYYEERLQFNEALDQWQILKSIHAGYPGLAFEMERLSKRKEQQSRESSKKEWVEEIDRYLENGSHEHALARLREAMAEFPGDSDLPELEKQAIQKRERSQQAAGLYGQARAVIEAGKLEDSLPLLRQARELDPRSLVIRTVLVNSLLDQARRTMSQDADSAETLVQEALVIQPTHAPTLSLRNEITDRKRQEFVSWCLTTARRMQAEGDLDGALSVVQKGLNVYPQEQLLQQCRATLLRGQAEVQRSSLSVAPVPSSSGAPLPIQPEVPVSQTPVAPPPGQSAPVAKPGWYVPAAASAVSDQSGIYAAGSLTPSGAERAPNGAITPPTAEFPQPDLALSDSAGFHALPDASTFNVHSSPPPKTRKSGWLTFAGAGLAVLLAVAVGTYLWFKRPKPAPIVAPPPVADKVNVAVHASPAGATITVDGQPCGTGQCQIDLAEGSHKAVAALDGYGRGETSFDIKKGSAVPPVEIALTAQLPSVILSTNLNQASVVVDSQEPVQFQNGEAQLKDVPAAEHTLHFKGEGYQAAFSIITAAGAAPEVKTPLPNMPLGVSIVAALGGSAKLFSNLTGAAVTLDGKDVGKVQPAGLDLTGLAPGSRELNVTPTTGQPLHVVFESGPTPNLVAYLAADKNVGVLRINTGEDAVAVYLNGQKLKRTTSKGQLVLYLPPNNYKVRVEKDGFQTVPEQIVDLKAGEESKLGFQMAPTPKSSTLRVRNAPAGAEVRVDGKLIGSVGADGVLSNADIPLGRHSIVIRRDGFKPLTSDQIFVAGTNVDLDGTLQATVGTLRVDTTPRNITARLFIKRQGDDAPRPLESTSLPEGDYTVTGHADGYEEASASVKVTGGKSVTVGLTFKPIPKAEPVKPSLSLSDLERGGGWTRDGSDLVRKGSGVSLAPPASGAGTYTFTARAAKGHRIDWVINFKDDRNYVSCGLDGDHFQCTQFINGSKQAGDKQNVQFQKEAPVSVSVNVNGTTISQTVSQNGHQIVSDQMSGGSFLEGRFGFRVQGRDQLAVSAFHFAPK